MKFGHYASDCWHKDDERANVAEAINEVRSDSIFLLAHDDSNSIDDVCTSILVQVITCVGRKICS